ncbi:MAG: alkaline phosphatase family protein [Flavobacteriales bacterium]|nr:alkaline phosphatase family protein [Flavobacteriales bacterium]
MHSTGANKSDRPAKRTLIIGWDAADWMILDPLFERGRMPRLRQLIANGTRADLGTLEPKLSPLLWTSIATGKTADKHGILNFVEPQPDGSGLRVSQSTTRKTKAIWNILSQAGCTTNVIGWYASHPAEPVRGHIISNLLQEGEPKNLDAAWPILPGVVHPEALAASIADSRQGARSFPREQLRKLLPKLDEIGKNDDHGATLQKLMAYAASIEAAAHVAMAAGEWDATMIFFDAIDTVGHHFMQFRPPRMAHVSDREVRLYGDVMDRVYEWHDEALGRLLDRAGPDTTVLLLSDHGFHSGANRPNLKGLPRSGAWNWNRVGTGPMVCSWHRDPVWCRVPCAVRARCSTSHPLRSPCSPFEASAAIKQLVALGYLAALPEDARSRIDLVSRESRFNLAVSLMSRNRYAEAAALFTALVSERPSDVRYGSCLVQCQTAQGAHADALITARDLLARDPSSREFRLMLAHALALTGDLASSLRESGILEKAAVGKPEFALGLAALAMVQGRYDAAAQHAGIAAANDPHNTAGHLALARAELARGRFEEAAGHALDALEIAQAMRSTPSVGAALA